MVLMNPFAGQRQTADLENGDLETCGHSEGRRSGMN